jgi:hypothetical protein
MGFGLNWSASSGLCNFSHVSLGHTWNCRNVVLEISAM